METSMRWYIRAEQFLERHAVTIMFILGFVLLNAGLSELVLAQNGGDIFKTATQKIVCDVLPGKFGAMLAAFSGIFALVAAAIGAYRGAWVLIFVSIGCFIAKEFVAILFGGTVENC